MAVSSNLRGIGAMVLATGCFVANDSCMKMALEDAPPMQVLIMRGIAALTWCVPVVLVLGLGRDIPKAFNPWVVLRALSEAFAVLGFVVALNTMPIADVTAIGQLSPFLVLVGASLIWGEKIGVIRLLLIALGILGALLVAQPGGAAASPYAIFGFVCAVGAAGRDLVTRKVPAGTPALVVAFSTLLIVMLSAAVASLLFETQVAPTSRHIWLMAVAGLFLMGGQFFIYLAFRLAPPRVVAPFNYCFLLWAGLSGLLLFNDVPNTLAITGMALILLAGLAVILLEGRTRQGDPKLSKA
jgi:drug/metabolite transporter (DMT)-like permease